MKRAFVVVLAFLVFFVPGGVRAGWLDSWFDQYVASAPDYFEGQKRGYIGAGSFSARWQVQADYPITIQLPQVRTGCGGIDVFLGGMNFAMLPDYIVQKLQTLIAAAPAVAFEVALAILSEVLSDKVNWVKNAVDMLNSLQIDECAIIHGVSIAAKEFVKNKNISEAWATFKQRSGLDSLYHRITKTDQGMVVDNTRIQQLVSGCPSDIKSLAFSKSIVEWALSKAGVADASGLSAYVRSIAGDVRGDGNGNFIYEAPCMGMHSGSTGVLEAMIGTDRYIKNSNGQCVRDTTPIYVYGRSYSSIRQWAQQNLATLATALRTKQQLDQNTKTFIKVIPAPLYQAIRTAVATGDYAGQAATYAEFAAAAVAFRLLNTVYASVLEAQARVKSLLQAQGAGTTSCNSEVLQSLDSALETWQGHFRTILAKATQEYNNVLTETVNNLQFAALLTSVRQQFESQLANLLRREM